MRALALVLTMVLVGACHEPESETEAAARPTADACEDGTGEPCASCDGCVDGAAGDGSVTRAGVSVEVLTKELLQAPPAFRLRGLRRLIRGGDGAVVLRLAVSGKGGLDLDALVALGQESPSVVPSGAVPALADVYRQADKDRRMASLRALTVLPIETPQICETLVLALGDPETGVKRAALESLRRRWDAPWSCGEAVQALLVDSELRIDAIETAASLGADAPRAIDVCAELLDEEDDGTLLIRVASAVGVFGVRAQPLAPAVASRLSRTSDPFEQRALLVALAALAPAGADAEPWAALLKSDSPPTRLACALATAKVGGWTPSVAEVVRAELDRPSAGSPTAVIHAAEAAILSDADSGLAWAALCRSLTHSLSAVRLEALLSLRRLGAARIEAPAAVREAIEVCRKDRDPSVRGWARRLP